MTTSHLSTYLNDHLAGSVTALELLAHLQKVYPERSDLGVLERLQADISEDRTTLENLMSRLKVSNSPARRAAGWVAERAARLKLAVDDPRDGSLRAFETVELISLGIEGKISLWKSLSAIAQANPALNDVDFAKLIARAEKQREELEPLHLAAARDALAHRA